MERRGAARQRPPHRPGAVPCFSATTMDELRELAEADDTEVVLAREAHGAYRLDGPPVQADDVSPEGEFPKYGRYMPVTKLTRTGTENGEALLETPRGLAEALVDLDLDDEGAEFVITSVAKSEDGAWKFVIDPGAPEVDEDG